MYIVWYSDLFNTTLELQMNWPLKMILIKYLLSVLLNQNVIYLLTDILLIICFWLNLGMTSDAPTNAEKHVTSNHASARWNLHTIYYFDWSNQPLWRHVFSCLLSQPNVISDGLTNRLAIVNWYEILTVYI